LNQLGQASYFSTLDLLSGYWQVGLEPRDVEKTAFSTPEGLYQFKRMPFGLSNAPATFQRLMDKVLGKLKYTMALVYLDDVIILSSSFEEHLLHLDQVLAYLDDAGLRLKASKCHFLRKEVVYLGHFYLDCYQQPILWRFYPEGREGFNEYLASLKKIYPALNVEKVAFRLFQTKEFGQEYKLP